MKTAIVTGASSGLGAEIKRELEEWWSLDECRVINWSFDTGVDVRNSHSINEAIIKLPAGKIDILVNCAGINRIGYLPQFPEHEWDDVMNTNAKGIFLTTKYLCDRLTDGTILNIVSNAATKPMTSSAAYNASKGAAKILTAQLARELRKTHNICVFSVSPNKLKDTCMSNDIDKRVCETRGWTPKQARDYQRQSLECGEETPPRVLAEFIAFLLSSKERHKYLGGCDLQYGL